MVGIRKFKKEKKEKENFKEERKKDGIRVSTYSYVRPKNLLIETRFLFPIWLN